MKLKRFLLRYDPPGVGLEVEADGEKSVEHKDLPAAEEITSAKDVKAVVDDLIAREPTLLTRKRHRSALIQLLGRLYSVEVDAEEDHEAGAGRGSGDEGSPSTAADGEGSFVEGTAVVVRGLSGKQEVYNGETGQVVKANQDKHKWEVDINGEIVKVKGDGHLLKVALKAVLVPEIYVAIRGLKNHIELNGCIARVAECHEEQQRYEVRAIESGQLFRVKKDNLVLIEATRAVEAARQAKENREPNNATPRKQREGSLPAAVSEISAAGDENGVLEVGSTVELTGLKTAQAYNGQQAEVLSVDRVRSRYEIKLTDGSVKTIRAENVRLVSSGKSPRSKRKP